LKRSENPASAGTTMKRQAGFCLIKKMIFFAETDNLSIQTI